MQPIPSFNVHRTLILMLFISLGGIKAASANDPVTVGDPSKPGDLPQAIYDSHQSGAKDITIRPGIYDLPSMKTQDTIVLDTWNDTTIHAAGVVMIFEELHHRPLMMRNCKNVTWDGGTFEFPHPTNTQGRVKALGTDAKGSYVDWQIDAGYPTNIDPVKSTYDIVDQATRVLKVATGDWQPPSAETLGPLGAFRLHYYGNPGFAVNDWLVTRAPGGDQIAQLDGCGNCTLENTIFSNGGFADFFETGGLGGNHYLKCKIKLGPRPPGATEDEIVSSGADGFHSVGTKTGPDIEDCNFTGVFLDDCIAIHGSFGRVIRAEGNHIVLKGGGGDPNVGDPLRISDTHGFFGQATVTAIERTSEGDSDVALDQDLHVPIDHSQDSDPKLGTKANNPNRCGLGYKILRCRLGDTRSRGILVKADDGIIEGCTIEGCGMSGVSVGPEFWWNEANYSWNVTVSHNTFRNCSKNNGDQGTIWVHWDGAIGNQKIVLEDNTVDTCFGQYVFRIEGTDDIAVKRNEISNSFTVKMEKPGNILWLNHSKNVALEDNRVSHQGSFAGDLVGMGPGVDSTDVKNRDEIGIVVTDKNP